MSAGISWIWRSAYSMAPSLRQVNMTFGATMESAILLTLCCVIVCIITLADYFNLTRRMLKSAAVNILSQVFGEVCLINIAMIIV